ncbi:MAG TPA: hypothetical protein PLV92_22315, partial [Pirellulaceae bacterium]|nr:hypothetical protein [Pirellulaceae bacterium]
AGAADVYGTNPNTCQPDGIPDSCQPAPDCDDDGQPDFCAIQAGAADHYGTNPNTCQPDGIPDSCQPAPDCDADGVPNFCALQSGAADVYGTNPTTCQPDGIPDSCQPAPDCDHDGLPDACELAAGAVDRYGVNPRTCQPDGIPDSCQPEADCNLDGIPDHCEIEAGAPDCDGNKLPDACQPDCNGDGTPDTCEPDCDHDGTPDACEPLQLDCNANGILDECDLLDPSRVDCDADGRLDECQTDCDGNELPDTCDIALAPEKDRDGDGILDACQCQEVNRRVPGSLLLYPEYDNRTADTTLISCTNVLSTAVEVHFKFVDGTSCLEFDFRRTLTPNDTLTFLTSFVNPNSTQGYVYAYAQDPTTHTPIVHNGLIGQVVALQGLEGIGHSFDAVTFRGIGDGVVTDLDGDGHRDLNGLEYSGAPEEILIPRFLGQDVTPRSELVLIALSGGRAFTTTLDFAIFNDNEEPFSAQYTFQCWERVPLPAISGVFDQDFLAMATAQDPNEILGQATKEA